LAQNGFAALKKSVREERFQMTEIFNIFTIIGICTTIYFIDRILAERKMHKLADQTSRRLREERRRQQLAVEWSNMTTAGNSRAVFNPAIGRWLVFEKSNGDESPGRS
jgi:hypothetical protein